MARAISATSSLPRSWHGRQIDTAGLVLFLVLLCVAELLVATASPLLVFGLHGGLIVLVGLFAAIRATRASAEEASRVVAASVALAAAPLVRIISLTLPLGELGTVWGYAVAGAAMLVIGVVAARSAGLNARDVGFGLGDERWLWPIIGLSVLFGFIEYWVLRPEPLGSIPWSAAGVVPAVAVGFFTGFPEELVFRGVIQTALRPVLGRHAWIYASAVFASLHIGYASGVDLIFVFVVGLFYGWVFDRTRSILGISLGHGIANITLLFVAPYVLRDWIASFPSVDRVTLTAVATIATALVLVLWQWNLQHGRISSFGRRLVDAVSDRGDRRRTAPPLLGGDGRINVPNLGDGTQVGPMRLTIVARPDRQRSPSPYEVPAHRLSVRLRSSTVLQPDDLLGPEADAPSGTARRYAAAVRLAEQQARSALSEHLRVRDWHLLAGRHALPESARFTLVATEPDVEAVEACYGPFAMTAEFQVQFTATDERRLTEAVTEALAAHLPNGYRLAPESVRGIVLSARVHDAIVAYEIEARALACSAA